MKLNVYRSIEPDHIHSRDLKELTFGFQATLNHIQKMENVRRNSLVWKKGNIIPIYKKGRKEERSRNYRLVSLTSVPGKITE